MTEQEAGLIIAEMQVNYPDTFHGMSDDILLGMIKLWTECFATETYDLVRMAARSYVMASTERFMPNVGQIKEQIRKLTAPGQMTEQQAWERITRALQNSNYNAVEEFANLPPALQRVVGSPGQLREWAKMDSEPLHSVVSSNIMRSFRAAQRRQDEMDKLPPGYAEQMRRLSDGMFEALPKPQEERSEADFEALRERRLKEHAQIMNNRIHPSVARFLAQKTEESSKLSEEEAKRRREQALAMLEELTNGNQQEETQKAAVARDGAEEEQGAR